MKVRVYRNLNRKCFSVQHKTAKGWRVLKHVSSIILKSPSYKVSEAGRNRVLREKRKNVHAWVEGEEVESLPNGCSCDRKVIYNPYKSNKFFYAANTEQHPICSFYAEISEDGIWAL